MTSKKNDSYNKITDSGDSNYPFQGRVMVLGHLVQAECQEDTMKLTIEQF
jgi:hypothetical protein